MRKWTLFAVGFGLAAAAGNGQAQHREAGAHEHGRGTLNIALEGTRLTMELEAPGADIVGFEHTPKTQKQRSAVAAAEKQLAAPQKLFELPAAAACALKEAKVALEGEGHDHDHHDGAEHHGGKTHDEESHGDKGGDKGGGKGGAKGERSNNEHSSFRAEYAFDCKAPASLTTIGFGYFKAFASAQKLDVTVITPKQQNRFEVNRANPRIDLGGMM